jgi:hypothetical protein
MNAEEFHTIAVGDIISYTLSLDQRSTNPLREYRGVVTKLYPDTQMVIVTLLDEGYEGLSEQVKMDQIQSMFTLRANHTSSRGTSRRYRCTRKSASIWLH